MTDPGIILFGKKIGLPPNPPPYTTAEDQGDDPKTPSIDEESMSENPQSTDGETMNLQPKTLKKPDKILPCPRCDSMNTKFCYFNNSNVNQPRHFCKSCQRYWTAGGTMRNMPVGAGRRKKKTPPSSHYRYIISQEALDSASSVNQIEFAPDSNRIQPKVLSFGQNPVQIEPGSSGKENKEVSQSQVQWIPTGSCPWPYNPWNTQVPFSVPVPVPMYPSPYWTSVSWLPQSGSILGKHSIEVESELVKSNHEESKKQRNTILTPKTLRIDDPDEAAKSSIWATLGIKNERMSSRGEIFKAFQSKGNEKTKTAAPEPESCPVLHANPAAFSRSVCFQERA